MNNILSLEKIIIVRSERKFLLDVIKYSQLLNKFFYFPPKGEE